jgi:hypothetical protein
MSGVGWSPPTDAVEAASSTPTSPVWSPPADAVAVTAPAPQSTSDNPDNAKFAAAVGPQSMGGKAGMFKYNPKGNKVDQFAGNVAAGVVKSVAGIAQAGADLFGASDLGSQIKNFSDTASASLTQGQDHGGIGQALGQALPYVLGGEGLAIPKVGGALAKMAVRGASGALAGGSTLQDGTTSGERNSSRLDSAGWGATIGAALGVGGDVAGGLVTKVANSKALTKVLNSLQDTIEDWKPDASEVVKDLRSHFNNLTTQYDLRMKRFSTLVAASGGVPSEGIVPQVKSAQDLLGKIADSDPAKGMLQKTVTTLQHVMPTPGRDAMKSIPMGSGTVLAKDAPPTLRASLVRSGMQLDDSAPKPGDGGQIAQLSSNIGEFLDKQGANVSSQASIALRDVKGSLDDALDGVKEANPAAKRVWDGIDSGYIQPTKPLKGSSLSGLFSGDPITQSKAIQGLFQTGDAKAATTLAGMISPKAKDQVVQTAVHEAIAQSFDKATAHIDASKFSAFFNDPNVTNTLKPFLTSANQQQLKGVQNFIKADAHASPGKGFFGKNAGSVAVGFGMFDGIRTAIEDPMKGAAIIGSSLAAAAGMKAITYGVDKLVETVPGRNFFNAASHVTPDSPQWTKLLDAWRPKLTGLLGTIWAQEQGQGQGQSPQQGP